MMPISARRVGLLAAQAGDPAIEVRQFALQRQHLAHGAAKVRLAFPQFRALRLGLLFHGQVRDERFDLEAEKILEALFEFERFLEKEAGVEREHGKLNAVLLGQVHHHQARALKTGADGGARPEALPGPGQHLFRGQAVKLLVQHADVRRGQREIAEMAGAGGGLELGLASGINCGLGVTARGFPCHTTRSQKSPKRSAADAVPAQNG